MIRSHKNRVLFVIVFPFIFFGLSTKVLAHPSKITETEGWIFNSTTMHYYKLVTGCTGWLSCEVAAVNEGGHLVTINDANEQNRLVSAFGGTDLFWIGFREHNET